MVELKCIKKDIGPNLDVTNSYRTKFVQYSFIDYYIISFTRIITIFLKKKLIHLIIELLIDQTTYD